MKRLARHLFTLCSAVSLLLCVAVCVLWVRSYWAEDVIVYAWDGGTVGVVSLRGCVGWGFERSNASRGDGWSRLGDVRWFSDPPSNHTRLPPDFEFAGFEYEYYPGDALSMGVPIWAVLLVAGIFPLTWWRGNRRLARRKQRRESGLCASCGYDLRSSLGRCPECGAAVNGSSAEGLAATALPEHNP